MEGHQGNHAPIPHGSRCFEMHFDFIDHVLLITVSDGAAKRIPLRSQTVADFYAAVRTVTDPDAVLLSFLQSAYEAAAHSAHWDRVALECPLGVPGVPRDMPS